jgi:hypothetical protein
MVVCASMTLLFHQVLVILSSKYSTQRMVVIIKALMNTLLQNMNCQVNVSNAIGTAIANSNLQSPSSHPFSCLLTPYYDASSTSTENDIKLQLMASDGLGMD